MSERGKESAMRYLTPKLLCLLVLTSMASADQTTWFSDPAPLLPRPFISGREWNSHPKPLPPQERQRPSRIVIHHAGVPWKEGTDPARKVRALQSWGKRAKRWPDVPYHYLISPDGTTFQGRDVRYQAQSNTDYPLNGVITVELFGDFNVQKVTREQAASLRTLLVYLCRTYAIPPDKLSLHREEAPGQTTCPGDDLARLCREHLFREVAKSL